MYSKDDFVETLNIMKSYSEADAQTYKAVELYLSKIYIETLTIGKKVFPVRIEMDDFKKNFLNPDFAIELFKQNGFDIEITPCCSFMQESVWIC